MEYLRDILCSVTAPFEKVKGEIKKFQNKIRSLKTWQKVLLLSIAIFLPAGIALASLIVLKMKAKKS